MCWYVDVLSGVVTVMTVVMLAVLQCVLIVYGAMMLLALPVCV